MIIVVTVSVIAMLVHVVAAVMCTIHLRAPERQQRWLPTWRRSGIIAAVAAGVMIASAALELLAPAVLDFLIGWNR